MTMALARQPKKVKYRLLYFCMGCHHNDAEEGSNYQAICPSPCTRGGHTNLCKPVVHIPDTEQSLPGQEHHAFYTVPKGLLLGPSTIKQAGVGVHAKVKVLRYSLFGPYAGRRMPLVDSEPQKEFDSGYSFTVNEDCGQAFIVDANLPVHSNWMRFMNTQGADSALMPFEWQQAVWFIALRDIQPGEELFVDYGENYLRRWIPELARQTPPAKKKRVHILAAKATKKGVNGGAQAHSECVASGSGTRSQSPVKVAQMYSPPDKAGTSAQSNAAARQPFTPQQQTGNAGVRRLTFSKGSAHKKKSDQGVFDEHNPRPDTKSELPPEFDESQNYDCAICLQKNNTFDDWRAHIAQCEVAQTIVRLAASQNEYHACLHSAQPQRTLVYDKQTPLTHKGDQRCNSLHRIHNFGPLHQCRFTHCSRLYFCESFRNWHEKYVHAFTGKQLGTKASLQGYSERVSFVSRQSNVVNCDLSKDCEFAFTKIVSLVQHVDSDHQHYKHRLKLRANRYKCPGCPRRFAFMSSVQAHCWRAHGHCRALNMSANSNRKKTAAVLVPVLRRHRCNACRKPFVEKHTALLTHKRHCKVLKQMHNDRMSLHDAGRRSVANSLVSRQTLIREAQHRKDQIEHWFKQYDARETMLEKTLEAEHRAREDEEIKAFNNNNNTNGAVPMDTNAPMVDNNAELEARKDKVLAALGLPPREIRVPRSRAAQQRSRLNVVRAGYQRKPVVNHPQYVLNRYNGKLHCSSCARSFQTVAGRRNHILLHTPQTTYQCSICPQAFDLQIRAEQRTAAHHARYVHSHKRLGLFACDYCTAYYGSRHAVLEHVHTAHDTTQSQWINASNRELYAGGVGGSCVWCGQMFPSLHHRDLHELVCHGASVMPSLLPFNDDFDCADSTV